jgi:protein-L-isoaspartate(D-aspartate) O-methyltransferase
VSSAAQLRSTLVADLIRSGDLVSPECIDAFLAVPRHVFVPRFFLDQREVSISADPKLNREWLELVYSDEPLLTQVGGSSQWLSSSSQPSLMAAMLEALQLSGKGRVLEIGTGTGYNAALLCEIVGDTRVTSVDIDEELITSARRRLASAGYRPTLVALDGAEGFPERSPYDRIIATCSVDRVPSPWLSQTAEEGLILVNLYRDLGGGAIAKLQVTEKEASGHFVSFSGGYMPSRAYTMTNAFDLYESRNESNPTQRPTRIGVDVFNNDSFGMFAALRMTAHRLTVTPEEEPEQLWLLSPDGSWACHTDGPTGPLVTQGGPARLWDTLESAYTDWTSLGSPPRESFGLTVTQTGEHTLWYDSPSGPSWTLVT